MVKVSIIGATGYVGAELARLLAIHPQCEIMHLASKSHGGKKFGELYPGHNCEDMTLYSIDIDKIASESDIVFTALPHGVSSETVIALSKYDIKIIDMSGDFRYDDEDTYTKWYNVSHPSPDIMKSAQYGLSEIYREKIAKAKIVANPGCYTTCSILPLYPLLKNKLIKKQGIIVDAKSGATGAGKKAVESLIFTEVSASLKAYNIAKHRHTSEIEQELTKAAGDEIIISFTPHLLPIKRGILATIYADLEDGVDAEVIEKAYNKIYGDKSFVKILKNGKTPEIKSVVGSNNVSIGYVIDERLNRIIVVSVIDNLIKGAAGQGIQNMNIMLGYKETTGLDTGCWYL